MSRASASSAVSGAMSVLAYELDNWTRRFRKCATQGSNVNSSRAPRRSSTMRTVVVGPLNIGVVMFCQNTSMLNAAPYSTPPMSSALFVIQGSLARTVKDALPCVVNLPTSQENASQSVTGIPADRSAERTQTASGLAMR